MTATKAEIEDAKRALFSNYSKHLTEITDEGVKYIETKDSQ